MSDTGLLALTAHPFELESTFYVNKVGYPVRLRLGKPQIIKDLPILLKSEHQA